VARRALALLAFCLLAPPAHAAGRFVHAFDADREIHATGNGFAWDAADGGIRVTDARGRTLHDVRAGDGCETIDASRDRVALLLCDFQGDTELSSGFLLDTTTGALTPQTFEGEPLAIGRWWIESSYNPSGCYHCESTRFVNWRTGERRLDSGDPFEPVPRDLDDPGLGPARRPYRRRGHALLVRRGDRWKEVARCATRCGEPEVWLRRVAYVDPDRGLLVERRPRHTRAWHVPESLRDAWLYRAGNTLVLADRVGGTWRVWRAER
jgi:hypothetical protein